MEITSFMKMIEFLCERSHDWRNFFVSASRPLSTKSNEFIFKNRL
jgi:hypothetical protein